MADVLGHLWSWSTTAGANYPQGSTVVGTGWDDNLREIQKIVRYTQARDTIASAATCDIGAKDAMSLDVTGTTTITSLGTVDAGIRKWLTFSGVLTFTHNATSLIIPGGASVTTAAGDVACVESLGSGNWRCLSYNKANGNAVAVNTLLLDGSVSSPALAFASETGLGLYRISAGLMGFSQGGTRIFSYSSTGVQVSMSGTTSAITLGTSGAYLTNGINVAGNIGVGSGIAVGGGFGANAGHFYSYGTAPSFNGHFNAIDSSAGNGNAYAFYAENSGGACFKVTTTGSVASDGGTTMTTPADYAEMFEWADGNPNAEDRVGLSVALVGEKIKVAEEGDIPIGIVSGNPAVLGDAGDLRWVDQYVRDEFNRPVYEFVELIEWEEDEGDAKRLRTYYADTLNGVVPPEHARREVVQRRKVNPAFNPSVGYTPRKDRKEWSAVGLMGKLRLRDGQKVAPHWMKMRDITSNVSEWLVR